MHRIFDRDTMMKRLDHFVHEDDARTFRIIEQQDCQPVIDHVQTLKSLNVGERQTGDFRYVGSIPMTWFHELNRRGVLRDQKALQRFFLNNSRLMFQKL